MRKEVIFVDEVCNSCRTSWLEHCMKCTMFQIKKILEKRWVAPEYRTYNRDSERIYRYSDRYIEQKEMMKAQERRQREWNYRIVDWEILPYDE